MACRLFLWAGTGRMRERWARPCQMKRLSADTIVLSVSSAGVSWQMRDRLVGDGIHDTEGYGKRAPSPAAYRQALGIHSLCEACAATK